MTYITQDWVETASEQEVFDYVSNHLLKQNCKSEVGGAPLYLNNTEEDGVDLRCAAGCLFRDEDEVNNLLNEELEYKMWNQLVNRGHVPNNQQDLIEELIDIHDLREPEHWSQLLFQLAVERGLTSNSFV